MKPTRALLVLAAAFAVAAGRAVGAPIRVVTLSTVLTEIAREVGDRASTPMCSTLPLRTSACSWTPTSFSPRA
jgi:hypothetical protein